MSQRNEYAIFTNRHKKKLVFYPVAKNANSSAKLFFLKHLGLEKKFYFLEDEIPRHKINQSLIDEHKERKNLVSFLPSYTPFKKIDVDEKCCLIRDPVNRFISCYNNRILYHQDLAFNNYSIDQVIEKLENNLFENKHFLPQSFWLGNNINYFTIVANVSNIKTFETKINNFFENKVLFPHIQTGKSDLKISLNKEQLKKIKKIYSADYDLIGEKISI